MRSLANLRFFIACAAALVLVGCLVSDLPVLDAKSGKARPFPEGAYLACPLTDGEIDADDKCDRVAVERQKNGGYLFVNEDEDPAHMRFRKIGRGGYAVQSSESDEFVYYYGRAQGGGLLLVMMNCPDLPVDLRKRLIARGDLETDDDDFTVCAVKTVRGLTESAKAYHRGEIVQMMDAAILISPAPPLTQTP